MFGVLLETRDSVIILRILSSSILYQRGVKLGGEGVFLKNECSALVGIEECPRAESVSYVNLIIMLLMVNVVKNDKVSWSFSKIHYWCHQRTCSEMKRWVRLLL